MPTGRSVPSIGQGLDLHTAVIDCVLSPDQSQAVIKTSNKLAVISVASGKQLSSVTLSGASLTGIAISSDGKTVASSNAGRAVQLFSLRQGTLSQIGAVQLPNANVGGDAYPCGLQFLDAGHLAVAANRDNSVMIVDIAARKVSRRIPVDTAPCSILVLAPKDLLVTCWSGPGRAGLPTAPSSGTQVQVDKRGIAVAGSLCRVNLDSGTAVQRVVLPLQPTELVSGSGQIFVACANGDAVLALDPTSLTVVNTIRAGKLSGSAPNSLAVDPAGNRLYVAFGGLDRVGAYDLNAGLGSDSCARSGIRAMSG